KEGCDSQEHRGPLQVPSQRQTDCSKVTGWKLNKRLRRPSREQAAGPTFRQRSSENEFVLDHAHGASLRLRKIHSEPDHLGLKSLPKCPGAQSPLILCARLDSSCPEWNRARCMVRRRSKFMARCWRVCRRTARQKLDRWWCVWTLLIAQRC